MHGGPSPKCCNDIVDCIDADAKKNVNDEPIDVKNEPVNAGISGNCIVEHLITQQ